MGFALLIFIAGCSQWWMSLQNRSSNLNRYSSNISLLSASFKITIAIGMIAFIQHSILFITIIIGLCQLFFAVVSSYSLYLLYKNQANGIGMPIFNAVTHWTFAILSLFGDNKVEYTIWRLAIYVSLLGINYLFDAVQGGYRHLFHYQHRPLRIPLPFVLTLFMPYQLLTRLQLYLEKGHDRDLIVKEFIQGEKTDIEVLIHTGHSLFSRIGHIDLAYKGIVYSFGNHDANSRKTGDMIGKGILLMVNLNQYIQMLNRYHITVISFGLKLNDSQLKSFEAQIEKLLNQAHPVELSTANQSQEFVGRLLFHSNARFFEFHKGPFQTYFLFGTNCVLFVDYLLWKSGLDMMIFSGVMTPGTYFDYLNREYQNLGSRVVSRKIFNPDLHKYISLDQSSE